MSIDERDRKVLKIEGYTSPIESSTNCNLKLNGESKNPIIVWRKSNSNS